MEKENLILADCKKEELKLLKKGIEDFTNQKFEIKSAVCNGKRSIISNLYRYMAYICYPLLFFIKAKKINIIVCWQQFFGLFYAFYCNIFKIKKKNNLIICNFTYKEKNGFKKKIYKKLMKYCLKNDYVDFIHVPSFDYAKRTSKGFDIPMDKFIIIPFGVDDIYSDFKDTKVEYEDYCLAIGRSNRDYDFLINVWKKCKTNQKLLIVCDEYKTKEKLPENIIIRRDITGNLQYPYIANCNLMIIPIKDENICSGDTVLLRTMSFAKPIVVTKPSTLAEMYINHGENGFCLIKDEEIFIKDLTNILNDKEKQKLVSQNARKSYEDNYSRYSMGRKLGEKIKNEDSHDWT